MMTTMESMTTIDLAGVDASAASAPETSIDQIHIETSEERFLSMYISLLTFIPLILFGCFCFILFTYAVVGI